MNNFCINLKWIPSVWFVPSHLCTLNMCFTIWLYETQTHTRAMNVRHYLKGNIMYTIVMQLCMKLHDYCASVNNADTQTRNEKSRQSVALCLRVNQHSVTFSLINWLHFRLKHESLHCKSPHPMVFITQGPLLSWINRHITVSPEFSPRHRLSTATVFSLLLVRKHHKAEKKLVRDF